GDVGGAITDAGEGAAFSTPKTFSVDGLKYDGKFVVKIENKSAYEGTSNKLRIVIDNLEWTGYESSPATSVDNNHYNQTKVYPTQVNDVLNIQSATKDFSVKVYNQMGSLIAEYKNANTIPFSHFAAGMYIIRIQSENK